MTSFFKPLADIEKGRRPIDQGQPQSQVLNEGDIKCNHGRVYYIDNAFDGQAWWCDDCPRHEKIDYSPGYKIKFLQNSLISTPNQEYGAEQFYAFRTDDKGIVHRLNSRVPRT